MSDIWLNSLMSEGTFFCRLINTVLLIIINVQFIKDKS